MRPLHVAACPLLLLFAHAHAAPFDEDAGRRRVEVQTVAQCPGKPVVVFENGARETFDTWDKVVDLLKRDATLFTYNRPGYGRSDEPDTPRDGRTIVDELRGVLRRQGLQPPYVLVGHSMGGLYMQLFARAYPREVQGLVLVDSLYPGAMKKTADFPWTTRLAKRVFFNRTLNREIDAAHETGTQVLALPWGGRIPVERLVNVPKSAGAIPVDFGVFNGGKALVAAIDAMYPDARTTIVDSDHRMQVATPEAVVAAIRRVLPAGGVPGC